MLFDRCWEVVKQAETAGSLTVEEALDVAVRLPQALFCAMMQALADNGEDPALVLVQEARLHEVSRRRLRDIVNSLRTKPSTGGTVATLPRPVTH